MNDWEKNEKRLTTNVAGGVVTLMISKQTPEELRMAMMVAALTYCYDEDGAMVKMAMVMMVMAVMMVMMVMVVMVVMMVMVTMVA